MDPRKPILWVHEEALGPANPALQDYPNAPGLFVFDDAWIQEQAISRKRIGFLYESALSLPLTLRRGDDRTETGRCCHCKRGNSGCQFHGLSSLFEYLMLLVNYRKSSDRQALLITFVGNGQTGPAA